MSLVQVRVELPAYAHSFTIQVALNSTVGDVKQEIYNTCPGRPRVNGQRIIWRGRYLFDHEKVDELWKSPDEPRIVHLAVHPSAWSSSPPELPVAAQTPSLFRETETSPPQQEMPPPRPRAAPSASTAPIMQVPHPLGYILFKHQSALSVLTGEPTSPQSPLDHTISSSLAVQAVEGHGWIWPSILDEEFPPYTEGGLKYQRVTIDGQDYLSLVDPSATPTPLQLHAFKVLSYTFTLLSIPISHTITPRPTPTRPMPIPPDVNELLQQLGFPQLRVAANQNQNPQANPILPGLREVPLRPLLAPMVFLLFRTVLLLYFVAPARKPIFGLLILVWMVYEIWLPIRNGIIRGLHAAAAAENQANQPVAMNQQPRPNVPNAQPGGPQINGPRPQNPANGIQAPIFDFQAGAVLDVLANVNVSEEERVMNETPGADTTEPSIVHKAVTFASLLLTTVHPAIWNTRRAALRQREGRIRTEANIRDAPANTEGEGGESDNRIQARNQLREEHNRRPRWIREYVDRVVAAEWVDDSD
ncbi:hypothetical protein H0H92_004825 [Tricholoma furcatifolium]|nr:hypothetical protein H0H92_004825 [Tricholoma furcatifolium]